MTKRDRVVLARLLKAHRRSGDPIDRAEEAWAKRLELVFGSYVRDRDTVIGRAIDRLELTPDGRIAEGRENEALIAEMIGELERSSALNFDRGGAFSGATEPAGKDAARIAMRRFGETLRAADERLDPKEAFRLTRSQRVRIRTALDQMRIEFYQADQVQITRFKDLFMRHIADPTSTREKLRGELVRLGHGDAVQPILDSAGRRITATEQADRIVRYEFSRLVRNVEEQGIIDRYYDGEPPDLEEQFRLWQAVGDDRTQPSHLARHGHVFSIAEWNRRDWGDGRFGLPPLRPHCRCDAIFVVPDWFSTDTRERFFSDARDEKVLTAVRRAA